MLRLLLGFQTTNEQVHEQLLKSDFYLLRVALDLQMSIVDSPFRRREKSREVKTNHIDPIGIHHRYSRRHPSFLISPQIHNGMPLQALVNCTLNIYYRVRYISYPQQPMRLNKQEFAVSFQNGRCQIDFF